MSFAPTQGPSTQIDWKVTQGIVLLTALTWVVVSLLDGWIGQFRPSIVHAELVSLSGGVAFLALLLGGKWGAVGIAGGSTIALAATSTPIQPLEIAVISAFSGLVPYICFLAACRILRVDHNLSTLRSAHLPLIAFALAVGSAVVTAAMVAAFDPIQDSSFVRVALASAAGNFLSCVGVMAAGTLLLRLYRSLTPRR